MSKVQHTARLHEKTVQQLGRGTIALPRTQRSHTTSHRWGMTVNRAVMEVARRVRRPGTTIRIINEGEVLIINKENA